MVSHLSEEKKTEINPLAAVFDDIPSRPPAHSGLRSNHRRQLQHSFFPHNKRPNSKRGYATKASDSTSPSGCVLYHIPHYNLLLKSPPGKFKLGLLIFRIAIGMGSCIQRYPRNATPDPRQNKRRHAKFTSPSQRSGPSPQTTLSPSSNDRPRNQCLRRDVRHDL